MATPLCESPNQGPALTAVGGDLCGPLFGTLRDPDLDMVRCTGTRTHPDGRDEEPSMLVPLLVLVLVGPRGCSGGWM